MQQQEKYSRGLCFPPSRQHFDGFVVISGTDTMAYRYASNGWRFNGAFFFIFLSITHSTLIFIL
jgi:hypothetical protein